MFEYKIAKYKIYRIDSKIFEVLGEALVEPNCIPPLKSDQISKPLWDIFI